MEPPSGVTSETVSGAVIERGMQTFVEVGRALNQIREGKLYREQGHGTFEEYCQIRWGMKRSQAYNYISACDLVENVHSTGQNLPSLTQAVEMAALQPAQQREVASSCRISFDIDDTKHTYNTCQYENIKYTLGMDETKMVNVGFPAELLERVETFRFQNRFATRVEAIRWLIEAALNNKLKPAAGKAAGKGE
jgi:hypothetical protein